MSDIDPSAESIPLTSITQPAPQGGEYVDTLERWGALPEKLPIPDVARYLAHLTKQNPAALQKIISDAVFDGEIRFWGLSGIEGWKEGMLRIFQPFASKPRLKEKSDGTANFSVSISRRGRLHLELMAVSPREAVALLAKRGRKIPDELRHLLPKQAATPASLGKALGMEETTLDPAAAVVSAPEEGVTRDEILAVFPPLDGQTHEQWKNMLRDARAKWLRPARLDAGRSGIQSRWNPAQLAICLAEQRHMRRSQLSILMRKHFREYLPEWEAYAGSFEN